MYTVYGGSYDPIHYGHLSLVEQAIKHEYKVIIVPAFRHAFGKKSAAFCHRMRMCDIALQACQLTTNASVCRVEQILAHGSNRPVYTYDVLCWLRQRLGEAPRLLVGPDIAAEWARWYKHQAIDAEFGRVNFPSSYSIRSTDIRQQLRTGHVHNLGHTATPQAVIDYILAHALYQQDTC